MAHFTTHIVETRLDRKRAAGHSCFSSASIAAGSCGLEGGPLSSADGDATVIRENRQKHRRTSDSLLTIRAVTSSPTTRSNHVAFYVELVGDRRCLREYDPYIRAITPFGYHIRLFYPRRHRRQFGLIPIYSYT